MAGATFVKPQTLMKAAEQLVEESEKSASGLVRTAVAEADNVPLARLLDTPLTVPRQSVSTVENVRLLEAYPDYINRTRNAIESPSPGLGQAAQEIRPSGRLLQGGRGRTWDQLIDDAIRSAALTVDRLARAQGRRLVEMGAHELAPFVEAARVQMITNSRAYTRALGEMRTSLTQTLKTRNLKLAVTDVTTPEGVWLFVRREGQASDILGEIFVPRLASGGVPKRPPVPQAAKPSWLHPDGTIRPEPPAGASHAPLGLPPVLIDEGPAALVEQMRRAEKTRQTGVYEEVFTKPKMNNLRPAEEQVAGTGIRLIRRDALSEVERVLYNADEVVTIEGDVGKLAVRLADPPPVAFDAAALEKVRQAFGSNYEPPFNQLHAWGRVLGDVTTAGVSVGPNWLNQLQLRTVERFLQSGKEASRIPLTVRSYTRNLVLNGKTYRFFRAAEYEFKLEDAIVRVNIEMTPAGAAKMSLSKGSQEIGHLDFNSWNDLPAWFSPREL